MKKISINNIIKFRLREEKTRKTFLNGLNKEREIKSEESGGNYWVRSLSAISNAFKLNNTEPIKNKIDEILSLFSPSLTNQTKDMYDRNLSILYNYEDFDFSNWIPENFQIISKSKRKTIIYIDTIPVQITPSQIYTYEKNGKKYVGAIWFVAKLKGYKKEELGMFAEALFIFIANNFDDSYEIQPENCLVVDVLGKQEINYKNLLDEDVPAILNFTLELIKKTI